MGAWGTVVLFTLTGGVAGFVATRLHDAERRVTTARAREEVARTLHDGVLQTLAVVQRRSPDPDLVDLAREQELELREFLFGFEPGRSDLGPALRQAASKAERHHDLRVSVILADEPKVGDDVVRALVGAVSEALTNATKHGDATHATVYVEQPDEGGVFCSVKDDGRGFDDAATPRASASADRSGAASTRSAGGSRSTVAPAGERRCDCGSREPGRPAPTSRVDQSVDEPGDQPAGTDIARQVRVVLADDHPIWRSGVRSDLGELFHVVGEAGDADEAIGRHRPHEARPRGVRPAHAQRRRHQGGPHLRRADPDRDAHRLRGRARPARRGGRRAPRATW